MRGLAQEGGCVRGGFEEDVGSVSTAMGLCSTAIGSHK